MLKSRIELFFNVCFWIFIFSSVNVDWGDNWFDASSRPNTPAPLSVLIFPIYFYVHALLLIPHYFSLEKWKSYFLFSFFLFIVPELIRVLIYLSTFSQNSFESELFSRDSFLFGAPSPFFFALNSSFIYRFGKDWILNKRKLKELQSSEVEKSSTKPYENANILSKEEASTLKAALETLLTKEQAFLNSEVTLRDLADKIETTEKKLSFLINQELNTSFYELLSKYRVEKFKTEVQLPANKNLSIVGVALNCGFPSKSSFYRAFKAQVGMSPSEYIKTLKKED